MKKNNKFLFNRVFASIFFISLGISGIAMIYFYCILREITVCDKEQESSFKLELEEDKMIINVLVLGVDTLDTQFRGRSDSIMVLSLDTRHKKIKATSLMRDVFVKIPKKNIRKSNLQKMENFAWDRLNAAYPIGGSSLAIETIERNFGIKIDRFISIDFIGFEKIIDAAGGISLNLTSSEVAFINKNSKNSSLKGSGVMKLNGNQALQYARDRDSIGSDYDRTKRQREVVASVFKSFKSANFAEITNVLLNMAKFVKTNFKTYEIIKLSKNSSKYFSFEIENFRIPTDDNVKSATIDGKDVLLINDFKKCRKDISNFVFEDIKSRANK
ncbi:MAG: LCP family protein [Oscillospiraceae bacterium]|nr:LCP family protein [Oscillospiraceae bacterium]